MFKIKTMKKSNPFAIKFPGDFKPKKQDENIFDDQDFLIKHRIKHLDKEIQKKE